MAHPFVGVGVPSDAPEPPAPKKRKTASAHPGLEIDQVKLGTFETPPRPLSIEWGATAAARFPRGAALGLRPLRLRTLRLRPLFQR